ncbi:uncharacterized protein MELLADRAFT_108664 [Melampsora larici-populina 98AG31]|uniref:Uncharacterized protein n=1 Tax=Melampsora larici-populina (strain 98AG31 / pathotype 3-4-7) TaxID=747676 RepID=F4RTU5_MELLP|nr:uncharacterized protein MELLADRAFT_108664 [Melampsora larici-populina 98AG31]EGG04063.1 hypothetical protein MELLADRAFT_108664 [Melampsora larici-populina 98AG31]
MSGWLIGQECFDEGFLADSSACGFRSAQTFYPYTDMTSVARATHGGTIWTLSISLAQGRHFETCCPNQDHSIKHKSKRSLFSHADITSSAVKVKIEQLNTLEMPEAQELVGYIHPLGNNLGNTLDDTVSYDQEIDSLPVDLRPSCPNGKSLTPTTLFHRTTHLALNMPALSALHRLATNAHQTKRRLDARRELKVYSSRFQTMFLVDDSESMSRNDLWSEVTTPLSTFLLHVIRFKSTDWKINVNRPSRPTSSYPIAYTSFKSVEKDTLQPFLTNWILTPKLDALRQEI